MRMFAIVTCPDCHNNRMIDLSSGTTSCPYCGRRDDTGMLQVKFKHRDQNVVRDVLFGKEDVPTSEDDDPLKALAYSVSHCSYIGEKMLMMADGLDRICGEFTLDDIERIVPGKGERFAETMLDACLIFESGPGKYRKA